MNGKTILEDYNNQSADINDFVTLTEMIDIALNKQRVACAKKFRVNAEALRIHPKSIVNLMQMILSASIEE